MNIHRNPFIRALFFGTCATLLLGSGAMANARLAGSSPPPSPSSSAKQAVTASGDACPSTTAGAPAGQGVQTDQADQTDQNAQTDEGVQTDQTNQDDHADQNENGSADQCNSGEPSPTTAPSGGGQSTAAPSDRQAECKTAAGMNDGSTGGGLANGGQQALTGSTKMTGLDHAIQVVMGNCIKDPQAPGLLNALRHLSANRDRHMARLAEKTARKASTSGVEHEHHSGHGKGKGLGD